ncbi:EcsC family protein [Lysinibacillus sphaericus]|uniref:EcsC family protein n=1 Tax=Lysinibacillus sphaericus TaxID=1421 RepID=UPI0018CDA34A|nr:EcsC family protein [Lysinibacillus sphaericus]MBG9453515.1 EcsC family protein [Lysinibacillus sphaericus]MBG9480342.1 EcsC family protein [Lysinibacillus sphaericus]MBG9595021.1 EcsC family protein [Lysinibacillus sphaericus]
MSSLTESNVGKLLEWTYEKAVEGIPGTDTAYELAESYLSKNSSPNKAIDSLVKWQTTKCATSGFLSGLGGIVVLPVAIPANIASVIYVQMRMIASIAHIRGYDLKDDQVQTFVYACLTGQSVTELTKQAGIQIGLKVGQAQIKRIPGTVLTKINQRVGFRLVTKFGEKGIINLGKMVPLLGGVIGGSVDAASTKVIASAAKKTFKPGGYDNSNKVILEV